MRFTILSLLLFLSHISHAGEADVLSAEFERLGGDYYRIKVTLQHEDEGWEHFAKAWEVLAPDGTILGTRILQHPHVKEQPFTRTLTLTIPKGIHTLKIRAYDLVHKYGGKELILDLNKEKTNETD